MGSFLVSPRLAHVREAPAGTWLNLVWVVATPNLARYRLNLVWVVATELQFIGWALVGKFIHEILVETM